MADAPPVDPEARDPELDARVRRSRWKFAVTFLLGFVVLMFVGITQMQGGVDKYTACDAWEERIAAMQQEDLPCRVEDELGVAYLQWSSGGQLQRIRLEYAEGPGDEHNCRWWARPFAEKSFRLSDMMDIEVEVTDRDILEAERIGSPRLQKRTTREELPGGGHAEIIERDHQGDGVFEDVLRTDYDPKGRELRRTRTVDGVMRGETVWVRGARDRLESVDWTQGDVLSGTYESYAYECE